MHEEKFTFLKNYTGFPNNAFDYLGKRINFSNVDKFIFTSKFFTSQHWSFESDDILTKSEKKFMQIRNIYEFFEMNFNYFGLVTNIKDIIRKKVFSPKIKKKLINHLTQNYKISHDKIDFYDHHTCHYLTPLGFYNIDMSKKILLVSFDGEGDFYSSKICLYENNNFYEVSKSKYENSLGLFYSSITKALGMQPNNHEYKVMGLAAFNEKNKYVDVILNYLKKIIFIDESNLTIKSTMNTYLVGDYLKKKLPNIRFDNFASAAQIFLEEIITKFFEILVQKYQPNTITLSGGLFLNVKLNQKLLEKFSDIKFYIQPTGGDESLGIGAAYNYNKINNVKSMSIENMYQGRNIDNKTVENYLINNPKSQKDFEIIKYSSDEELNEKISELIIKNEVVARVDERSEWGARSLCNRSLLVNPKNYKNFSFLNDLIKKRDFWMPFAPVILDEWADVYIENWNKLKNRISESSEFMTVSFNGTKKAQEDLICAIHPRDKTLRAQILRKNKNIKMYNLLKIIEKKLNIGGLLNTSLNLHGKPLNDTIDQALITSKESRLEHLVINNYYFRKK